MNILRKATTFVAIISISLTAVLFSSCEKEEQTLDIAEQTSEITQKQGFYISRILNLSMKPIYI